MMFASLLERQRCRAAAGRLLVAFAGQRSPRPADLVGDQYLVLDLVTRLGRTHGVLGLIPPDGWPPAFKADLEDDRLCSLRHHLAVLSTLCSAAAAFDRDAIPWLVIKGPVLAEIMYDRPDHRSYGDLDLLVPAAFLGQAISALESAGATMIDQNWTMVLDRMHGEVHLRLGGTEVDLHWHLMNQRVLRSRFPIDIGSLFDRRRMVTLGSLTVPTLGAVDTVVHTAMHAAFAGADRLAWLSDVDRCIRSDAPPWDEVVARSAHWKAELPVATTLWRAHRVLGTPVPNAVLRSLGHPIWRSLLRLAQASAPLERLQPGRSFSRLVARAAGDSTAKSTLELARRSVAALRPQPFAHERPIGSDHNQPPAGSLLYPSGGPTARDVYLTAVALDRSSHPTSKAPTLPADEATPVTVPTLGSPYSRSG